MSYLNKIATYKMEDSNILCSTGSHKVVIASKYSEFERI